MGCTTGDDLIEHAFALSRNLVCRGCLIALMSAFSRVVIYREVIEIAILRESCFLDRYYNTDVQSSSKLNHRFKTEMYQIYCSVVESDHSSVTAHTL